jgi:hypothetical protein
MVDTVEIKIIPAVWDSMEHENKCPYFWKKIPSPTGVSYLPAR